ncbi:E3 ubiquitin- ligase COP1-like [Olea europaea subsp. europaea]|uniref:E3 ubiquitin- ligase COP1-like n=1 Tax=Olea europaea subsp. europaea TaxID=158383 RepID=A0A8S0RQ91_OLEEU|nr:E3 ubiquitin- ligase COP1-like [Olea europaea subsp. europaea]
MKELDSLLSFLAEKKRKMEQEETERNMQILLEFLHSLKKQKVNELNEVQNDIQYVKEDVDAVERHRIELYRARDRYSVKLRLLGDDPMGLKSPTSSFKRISTSHLSSGNERGILSENFQHKKVEGKAQLSFLEPLRKDTSSSGPTSQHLSQASLAVKQKKRVHAQFNDLQEFYLQKRRQSTTHLPSQDKNDKSIIHREVRHGDRFHSTNIVSSIDFDRDDELFATAGVSRCIKVFDFSLVVNEHADVHCPVVEMSTQSKLSCLSWNKYSKNLIASSDYEGIVTIWDATTQQNLMEYEEHEKRA